MSQFPEEALDLSSSEGFGYFPGYLEGCRLTAASLVVGPGN